MNKVETERANREIALAGVREELDRMGTAGVFLAGAEYYARAYVGCMEEFREAWDGEAPRELAWGGLTVRQRLRAVAKAAAAHFEADLDRASDRFGERMLQAAVDEALSLAQEAASQGDTMERIRADAVKRVSEYWGCCASECLSCPAMVGGKRPMERYGVSDCGDAMALELIRRTEDVCAR